MLLTGNTSRLYREQYATFEEYCGEKWGIARRSAYQLMDAAKVIENVRNCAQLPAAISGTPHRPKYTAPDARHAPT